MLELDHLTLGVLTDFLLLFCILNLILDTHQQIFSYLRSALRKVDMSQNLGDFVALVFSKC